MIVGVISWDLQLAGCASLKDKRRIVKSIKDRLHRKFNVSVAETDHQDLWQRSELACCVVATDRRQAEKVLGAADGLLCRHDLARIINSTKSFL